MGAEAPVEAISTSSSSSLASSRASSEAPETVRAIIYEIDAALHYTNSQRARQRPVRFRAHSASSATTTATATPPTSIYPASLPTPISPVRQRPASSSSGYSSSSSSSSSSASSPLSRARTLRRVFSPRDESLREVRARDSDICLQRVYERQVMMYLDGSIFAVRPLGVAEP
ncbi:hypothetical protein B0J12DRAFT_734064 [Macrophomina phaseolina]|uniref:Uncharacterized protein n=1 Tax=Macrophomina phaseolina TaxID=35725 RepID=A0ABQ8GTP3_9PEZI|nr:hypothetical protein B0J12DRAFT_734064 [Macrophomina phaseolina]